MHIEKLTVRNFRCFAEKEVTFSPGFNVLIGDNGVGKTALLDALKVSLARFIDCFGLTQGTVIYPKYFNAYMIEFDTRVINAGTGDQPTLERVYPVNVGIEAVLNDMPLRVFEDRYDDRTGVQSRESAEKIVQQLKEQIPTENPPILPVIAYFTSRRSWSTVWDSGSPFDQTSLEREVSGPTTRLDCYRTALAAEVNERKVQQWLMRFELSVLQRGQNNQTMDAAKRAIVDCLEGFEALWFDAIEWNMLVRDTKGNVLPTRMLSDGQRTILSIVSDIAYRCVTLNPELRDQATKETPGVVLIDELDLHLHPKWQRRIVDDLRRTFPKIQFIATTHSPLIIQSLRPGELIDLGTEVNDAPEEYVGKSPEDILENVMEVPMPQRSQRSLDMIETAERYYRLLSEAPNHSDLPSLRTELDRLMEPYEDNEAFIAALRLERAASGIDSLQPSMNGHTTEVGS